MYFTFDNPEYLAFLFVIPLLIFIHFFTLKNIRGSSLKFANFEAIARIKGIDIYSKSIFSLLFNILFVILLVFALSGLNLYKEVDASSFSFVIAIDSSASMTAKDLYPDRLSSAKETAVEFVKNLPYESYIGVISFSGNVQLMQEVSNNKQRTINSINDIYISNISGTDIYDAVFNSVKMLKDQKNKAVVLISDGQINIGNITDAMDYANENGAIVNTIAIGSQEGGATEYGYSKVDLDSLKSLAYNTGGKFFIAENQSRLTGSFSEITQTTKKVGKIGLINYLLIAGILLFIIKFFLTNFNKISW